jgi:Domain of unknown function (DUF6265)
MRSGAFPILCLLLAAACSENTHRPAPAPVPATPPSAEATDQLADYRSLIGEWVDRTTSEKFTCYEQWTAEGDSALRGFGYVMAKEDTVFIEDLRVELVDGQVVYSARIDSQNNGSWIPFTAQESGPDSLIFENPGHDFPQCITYVRDSTNGWAVAVTGNENGVDRTENFRFVRM